MKDRIDAIGLIDCSLIEKAEEYTAVRKKRSWTRVAVVAACLCLVIGSVAAVAATGLGTRIIGMFTRGEGDGNEESGYDLNVDVIRFGTEDMSEEIRSAGNIIRQQVENYLPFDNKSPNTWETDFETLENACEYIGIEQIRNNISGWNRQPAELSVLGDDNGNILMLEISSDKKAGDIRMQFFTRVYTDKYDGDIITGVRSTEEIGFRESYFTTDNDIMCHVIEMSPMESGYMGMDGYITENGILYNLHIAYLAEDSGKATDLMHEWAGSFGS